MEQHSDDQDKKTDWAEARTDWAEDRTVLANERTFAGWMRTGMAAVAVALGLKAVFGPAEPDWIPKTVASVFILAAVIIFFSAWRNSTKGQNRLDTHDTEEQSSRTFGLLAAIFSVAALATGAILWTL
jgi:putative membrane protein